MIYKVKVIKVKVIRTRLGELDELRKQGVLTHADAVLAFSAANSGFSRCRVIESIKDSSQRTNSSIETWKIGKEADHEEDDGEV